MKEKMANSIYPKSPNTEFGIAPLNHLIIGSCTSNSNKKLNKKDSIYSTYKNIILYLENQPKKELNP